jgi:hypothetical protein
VAYVRNSRQQYLEFGLPEGAEIWHAFVAGEPVTPFQEKRAAGKETATITKLPIARARKSQEAFEVRLRYSSKLKPLGLFGVLDLECPRTNIGIMRLGWMLALPKGYDIIRDTGNVTRIEGPESFEFQLKSISADASFGEMKRVSGEGERGEEGRAATLQSTSNAIAIQRLDENFNPLGMAGNRSAGMQSIYTGKKPDLPNKFYYQSLIISTEKPARIRSQYVRGALGMPATVVLVAVVAFLCYAGWRSSRRPPAVKFAGLVVVAVLALGVRTLAEGSYNVMLSAVFWTVLCAAAVMGLSDLLKAVQATRRPPSA